MWCNEEHALIQRKKVPIFFKHGDWVYEDETIRLKIYFGFIKCIANLGYEHMGTKSCFCTLFIFFLFFLRGAMSAANMPS